MSAEITIVIVEDDPIFREFIGDVVNACPQFNLVGSFADVGSAIEGLAALKPRIVLVDLDLNGESGVGLIENVKEILSDTEFIVLTVFSDSQNLFEALKAGASGYLLKDTEQSEIVRLISEVEEGGAPMSPKMAKYVVDYFRQETVRIKHNVEALTERENQILDLLADGFVAKKIAQDLELSYQTIRSHQKNIYKKLQVNNLQEAISMVRPTWK